MAELCRQVSRIHEVILRQYPKLVLQILVQVLRSCIAQDPQMRFLSRDLHFTAPALAGQVEVLGELCAPNSAILDGR